MKIGYARLTTDDQIPAQQLSALKKAGYKTVFKDEGLSGATAERPALLHCLNKLLDGDTLIFWKLDRLGRDLRTHGVKCRSITEAIDTGTPAGLAM